MSTVTVFCDFPMGMRLEIPGTTTTVNLKGTSRSPGDTTAAGLTLVDSTAWSTWVSAHSQHPLVAAGRLYAT